MKRFAIVIFAFCLVLLMHPSSSVHAQTDTGTDQEATSSGESSDASDTYSDKLRKDREMRRADRPPLQTDVGDPTKNRGQMMRAVKSRLANRLSPYMGRLMQRADDIIARYEQIIPRIERRIATVESETGVDLSTAQGHVAQASESVRLANSELDAAQVSYAEAVDSEDPKELFRTIHNSLTAMRGYLSDAHSELKQAISAIRNAIGTPVPPAADTGTDEASAETNADGQ